MDIPERDDPNTKCNNTTNIW